MIRVSVKTDDPSPAKIKLSESAESPIIYHVEIDRRRQNKNGQRAVPGLSRRVAGVLSGGEGGDQVGRRGNGVVMK